MLNPLKKDINVSGVLTIMESRKSSYEPLFGSGKFFFLNKNYSYDSIYDRELKNTNIPEQFP